MRCALLAAAALRGAEGLIAPRPRAQTQNARTRLPSTPTEDGGPIGEWLEATLLNRENPLYVSRPSAAADALIAEDAGVFDYDAQTGGWSDFLVSVGSILGFLAVAWVYPPTGYSDDFMHWLETDVCRDNSHLVTLAFGVAFPIVHSGLASLRPAAEKVVGARAWRWVFAMASLPLAYSWIVYFIAHAHDGLVFWDGQPVAWAHGAAWCVNFLSFFFLYPSVFNLKEVAAVEEPKLHLWETGVIRITRHPQMVGQVMWSAAHLAMVGSTFTMLTMALLVGHHVFAVWNGDRRLLDEHGARFEAIRDRTSVVPFAAILDGRQELPSDYWKELVRAPYALIAVGTLGAYAAHPYMQAGAALVRNTGWVEGGVFDGLLP